MQTPTVSFVVPCYNLAHLLPECIDSILSQSYGDFEILIMDDCSPDNTPEVAQSYKDPRVKYIRNDPNLGHLRNYNKGISLSHGKYVWLISADDYLLRNYVLQRYVALLEKHPNVGYTFCPGVGVGTDQGEDLKGWVSYGQSIHGKVDRIYDGHVLLNKLLHGNTIVAASGLVRRKCYEKVSLFPLNMPWAGDWYLWCVFALHYNVGYFSEPMVCYRAHELSMTNKMWTENAKRCCEEEVAIPWAVKRKADELGLYHISKCCLKAIAEIYARNVVRKNYRMAEPAINLEEVENSLHSNCTSEKEIKWLRARVLTGIGNEYFWKGEQLLAKKFYRESLKLDPIMLKTLFKRLLLSFGSTGQFIWKCLKCQR